MRALIQWMVAACLCWASLAFAQNHPPAAKQYCFADVCYDSRGAAEAAMRASWQHGELLRETSSSTQWQYFEGRYQDVLIVRYTADDQPPDTTYAPAYYNGWSTDACSKSSNPDFPHYCISEEEAVRVWWDYIRAEHSTCQFSNARMTGRHREPYSSITQMTGNPGRGKIAYGWDRLFEYDIWCPGWSEASARSNTVSKWASFDCPSDFYVISAEVDRNSVAFPKVCRTSVARTIKMAIKQVSSCPANANPCHPATGDKSRAETDFLFAGRPFVRYYHSLRQLPQEGAGLGSGWSHTYSMKGHGRSYVVDAEGNYEGLYGVGSDKYRGVSTVGRFYKELPDYSGELHEPGGDIKRFDAYGFLTSITNPGNPDGDVTLIYEPSSGSSRALTGLVDRKGRKVRFERSSSGLIDRVVLPDGQVVSYGYDAHANLVSVDYGNDHIKHYVYAEPGAAPSNDRNALTGIISEDGRRFGTFKYDDWGRVAYSGLHGSAGMVAVTQLFYKTDGSVEVATEAGGTRLYRFADGVYREPLQIGDAAGTATFNYSGGRLQSRISPDNVQTSYEYRSLYRSATIEAEGTPEQRRIEVDRDTVFNHVVQHRVLDLTGTLKSVSAYTENARGQITVSALTDPARAVSRTTTNTYCEQEDVDAGTCPRVGLLLLTDGPRTDVSDVTRFAYYPADDVTCATAPTTCSHRKGDLWKVTNALGQVTETLRYDGAGRPLSARDANGVITELEYHPRGWLTARKVRGADDSVETDDQITRIDYYPTGLVQRTTLPDGSYTEFTYDAAHRLTDITDAGGNRIHYTLDNAGNRTKEDTIGASGVAVRTLSRVYNQLGQLKTALDAYQSGTSYTYDANGNTDLVTDALSRVSDNDYDPLNRLTKTIQDVGGINATTEFKYDSLDNLTAVIDPKGLTTGYEYNGLGDLLRLTSPDTGVTTYTYDSAGNRATQKDARGVTTTYGYDALNRLKTVVYPTTSMNVTYTYDVNQSVCATGETFAVGRLTHMKDHSGTTQYCYDRFGRMVRKVQTTNSRVFVLRYAYTKGGQVSAISYPDGTVADYQRDNLGRVTEVGVTRPGQPRQVLLTGATYYPFGPVASWTFGNGRAMQRVLDQNYQPGVIQDSAGELSLGYEFDVAGNLTTLRDGLLSDPPKSQYSYDALNRLTQVKDGATGAPIETYGYDATGNRTSLMRAGATTTYTYPSTSHRLTQVGSVVRSYDAAGNTTAIGGSARQFTYYNPGRLGQVKANGATLMNYVYNGKGEQVRRYLGTANTFFLYDEAGHWLGEYANNASPTQQVIWLDDLPVGVIDRGTLHYIEADHLGTPRLVVHPQRNVAVWKWDLTGEAFGDTPPKSDPDGDGVAFTFDLRFPGQRYDAYAGLNYNYFRDYEPGVGRYMESDPAGLGGGPNTYVYTNNMPTIAYDPKGLAAVRLPPYGPGQQLPYGTIYCDDGVVTPFVNWRRWPAYDRECIGDCIVAHEQSHASDATRSNPGVCRYWGWVPFVHPRGRVGFDTKRERLGSEFGAYAAELRCLAAKLSKSGSCVGGMCEKVIRGRIDDIINIILPTVYQGTYPNGMPGAD